MVDSFQNGLTDAIEIPMDICIGETKYFDPQTVEESGSLRIELGSNWFKML